jgi:hypothetical protein
MPPPLNTQPPQMKFGKYAMSYITGLFVVAAEFIDHGPTDVVGIT